MIRFEMRWVLTSAVTAMIALSGCAAPEAPIEKRGSSTSRLGAPKASLETPASAETTEQFGIVQWKIFKGKKDLFMTGYDAKGKAVKGLTAGFGTSADESESVVHTKINDGSSFTAVHGLTTNKTLANRAQSDDETAFMKAAFVDASKTNLAFRANVAGEDTSSACGADLSAILAQSLSCTQGKSKAAQAACIAAAKKAAASSGSCQGSGTTTPGTAFDPNAPAYNPLSALFNPAMFDMGKLGSLASQLGASYGNLGGDVFGMGEMGEVCADGATGEVGWGSGGGLDLGAFDMGGGGGWGEFECGAADWFGGGGGFDLGGYDMGGGGW